MRNVESIALAEKLATVTAASLGKKRKTRAAERQHIPDEAVCIVVRTWIDKAHLEAWK